MINFILFMPIRLFCKFISFIFEVKSNYLTNYDKDLYKEIKNLSEIKEITNGNGKKYYIFRFLESFIIYKNQIIPLIRQKNLTSTKASTKYGIKSDIINLTVYIQQRYKAQLKYAIKEEREISL